MLYTLEKAVKNIARAFVRTEKTTAENILVSPQWHICVQEELCNTLEKHQDDWESDKTGELIKSSVLRKSNDMNWDEGSSELFNIWDGTSYILMSKTGSQSWWRLTQMIKYFSWSYICS